jgi:Ca2+-binding EF-hand superfamily protein
MYQPEVKYMNIKKQFNIKPVIAAISIAALSGVTYAAEFSDLDVDVDGKLNQSEMQEYQGLLQHWAEVDVNGDGMIDESEFAIFVKDPTLTQAAGWQSGGGSPGAALTESSDKTGDEFVALDIDRDGNLSKDELKANADAIGYWANYDVNKDDYMDQNEYSDMRNFNTLDMDHDGNLSQAEMQAHPGVIEYWGDVDANRDEYIDREEFASMTTDETLSERTGWQKSTSSGPGPATPAQNN